MKRKYLLMIICILTFSLTGCGGDGEQTKSRDMVLNKSNQSDSSEKIHTDGSNWKKSEEESDFRTYKTLDEMLTLFESGDLSEFVDYETENGEEVVLETGDNEEVIYQGDASSVIFDENIELPEENVTFLDWRSLMTEEELAEYDAFDPNDPQWQQYEAELQQAMEEVEQYQDIEASEEDYQQQIDEAMKELEGMEIPEEYMQYLPEGFDINSLLQQYQ